MTRRSVFNGKVVRLGVQCKGEEYVSPNMPGVSIFVSILFMLLGSFMPMLAANDNGD